ncbi:MAG: glycosyl hydrolase [Bacteroidetes bacterium]|nr:glycosyl hydrolase [Bacteroidota bacterium]
MKKIKTLRIVIIGAIIIMTLVSQLNYAFSTGKPKAGKKQNKVEKTAVEKTAKNDANKAAPDKDTKKKDSKSDTLKSASFSGLKWRSIGPAFASGRIADFAVNPKNHSEWFVAAASGHVWKTLNNGTTFDPVFDNYGVYSTSTVIYDPNNTNVVWVGTGENNHQRALGYGNGVYKSTDGGASFTNMGLKESRQIGKIVIDPRNSDVVFVAAEGSVWGPGGDRGLYKTTDGGKSWKKVLNISENTGVNNILIDPRNPDLMYASSEQRRRHVFTKIGGGPETALYKSTNAGESWDKMTNGLPSADMGGIGMAISPVNPDIIYAIIEASADAGGFYRSNDRGSSWQKMSGHFAQGQYYNEIYCDPKNADKVYSMETVSQVTEDGGKSWQQLGNNKRHVDDHAFWIDNNDTRHFLIGCDGGVYESFDGGANFLFKSNLPITQFYRVQVDNSLPFYYVYGGTQDNNSMGGPSRNISRGGVVSDEWFTTNGGDGFWSQIDPEDPNIAYAESQYGGMVRYDRKSQEAVDIRPEPRKGEDSYKWNWNTPLILSSHSHTRLYCSANKVFRSDDRGNTWKVISDDLTAQIDRNTWPVMGKYWPSDAVAKDISTSQYGTIISLEESPLNENLLYAGTDDGLIRVTNDGGTNWAKYATFPGIPENTYVSDILASKFDENVVFASFDNILRDDFKPYLLKSTDKGKSWVSISGNLPLNGTVHSLQQDFVNPDLLFAGTEFGFYFTIDGGKTWVQLKSGMPPIPVRDIAIQKRENDIVVATFGRGFYVLDDYTPLRTFKKEILDKEGYLFPVKDALMYIPGDVKDSQGSTYFVAKNPDFGAVFTYSSKADFKSMKDQRKEKEAELFKKGEPIPQPSDAVLEAETKEIPPYLTFTVTDESGNIARMIRKAPSAGINRVNWDLRYQSNRWVEAGEKTDPLGDAGSDVLAMPGKYKVTLSLTSKGETKDIAGPVEFNCVVLNNTSLPAADRQSLVAFHKKVSEISRVMQGTELYAEGLFKRSKDIIQALDETPKTTVALMKQATDVSMQLDSILNKKFNRRSNRPSEEENPPAPVTLNSRLGKIAWTTWGSTTAPTQSQLDAYSILMDEFPPVYNLVKKLGESDIPALENELEKIGAPVTPGRIPEWK